MKNETAKLRRTFNSLHKAENKMLIQIENDIIAKVPKDKLEIFYRTLIAAETLLFDEKSHQNMELIKNPMSRNRPVETIATGVAGLMWLLYQQSKKTLPVEAIIYGGIVSACVVWDFAERGLNMAITPELVSETTQLMCEKVFEHMGITPEQLKEAIVSGKKEIDDYHAQQAHLNKKMPSAVKAGVK